MEGLEGRVAGYDYWVGVGGEVGGGVLGCVVGGYLLPFRCYYGETNPETGVGGGD